MKKKIVRIEVDRDSVNPALLIRVDLEFGFEFEAPISIKGRLSSSDGKVLSYFDEYKTNSSQNFDLYSLNETDLNKRYNENSTTFYSANLTAVLSSKAIELIENQREKNIDKSVVLLLDLVIKYLDSTIKSRVDESGAIVSLKIEREYEQQVIKQSDWIKNYAPYLGIGDFLLLELPIPSNKKVSDFWKQLYERLVLNLNEMEESIRFGDWYKTMFFARKFFENIKFGDDKPAHKKFKAEFDELMKKDQHSKEGVKNLYDAIWKFFEFVSKYVHDKDKVGNIHPTPVTSKEDAYFAYALALGLLNMIGKKMIDK